MIIPQIIGGLGNQMFQYAAARALSIEKNTPLKLDISSFKNYKLHQGFELGKVFNCEIKIAEPKDMKLVLGWNCPSICQRILARSFMAFFRPKNLIYEPHPSYWSGIKYVPDNAYLVGYWQSENYFSNSSEQIRKDFSFREPLKDGNLSLQVQIAESNSVSLHIRRGDYVTNSKAAAVHGLCTIEYYYSAIQFISSRIENPVFYIFSDDIRWVKENLKISFLHHFIDGNYKEKSNIDMRLMSQCKHHIIANSSFSWWGAWLGENKNKIVVAPARWFLNNPDIHGLLPSSWVKL